MNIFVLRKWIYRMDEKGFHSSEVVKIYQVLKPTRELWLLLWTSFQHNIFSTEIPLYISPEYKICLRKELIIHLTFLHNIYLYGQRKTVRNGLSLCCMLKKMQNNLSLETLSHIRVEWRLGKKLWKGSELKKKKE